MVKQLQCQRQYKKLKGGARLQQIEAEVSTQLNSDVFLCRKTKKKFPLNGKKLQRINILDVVNNCHIEFDEDLGLPSQSVVPHSVFAKSEIGKNNQQINEFCELGII